MNAWDTLGNPGCGRHDIKPYLCKFHQASESSNSIREFFMRIETTRKIRVVVDQSRYLSENLFMLFHGAWMDTFGKLGYLQVENPIRVAGTQPFVIPGEVDLSHIHAAMRSLRILVQIYSIVRTCEWWPACW